jgi:hypothetical protein
MVIDLAGVENPSVKFLHPEDVIDISIVRELDESGFISTLK